MTLRVFLVLTWLLVGCSEAPQQVPAATPLNQAISLKTQAKPEKAEKRTYPLSDSLGKVRHVLMHFADYDLIPTLYSVFNGFSKDTVFTIAVNEKHRADVLKELTSAWHVAPNRVQIIEVHDDLDFWVRDVAVVTEDKRILLPARFKNKAIPESLSQIQRRDGYQVVVTDLVFDGGNIVTTPFHVFVGFNLIADNISKKYPSPKKVKAHIEKIFERRVVVIGNAEEAMPHGHIDMFVTPVGEHDVILGDVQLGVGAMKADPGVLNVSYARSYFDRNLTPLPDMINRMVFATPDFMDRLNEDLVVMADADSDITLASLFVRNDMQQIKRSFQVVEHQLKEAGFTNIYKLPFLTNQGLENSPFITYNNMLIESDKSTKRAYLPRFNIEPLDQKAAHIMKEIGFEVIPVDVQNISFYDGTLRCVTQILERES